MSTQLRHAMRNGRACHSVLIALLLTLGVSTLTAQTMMPLPPYNNTYNGMVRGFWFNAPTDFRIVGVRVPTDVGTAPQNVQVVRMNATLQPWPATTTNYTTLGVWYNVNSTTMIPCDILVQTGDIIGIIGSRGSNGSTQSNSYSTQNSPYTQTNAIFGLPVTLHRFGHQGTTYPVGAVWWEPNYQVCRVEMYYAPAVTVPNDVGIASIDSPMNFCAGNEDVIVTLKNFGTNQVTSATINWTINGAPQPAVSWTGMLDTLNFTTRQTQVNLGTRNFQAGVPYTIAAWTTMPNGVADTVTYNDSTIVTVQAAMAGTFTIGGASPDYTTFAAAASDLVQYGLCGPVVFNVRSGTYNERVELDAIAGASAVNTVTFQSETGNRADVTITNTSSSTSNNGVVHLGGATFVTFKNMTMRNGSNGTYCTVVELGTSTDCTIESCELVGGATTYTGYYAAVVNGYGANNHRTTIRDCGIRNGSIGLYMYGTNNVTTQDNCVVQGNQITGAYYTGYYSFYQGFETFHDNYIEPSPTGYPYMYATFFYYGHDASVERNTWVGKGRNYCYGIYFYYQNYYVPGNSRFVNNFVTMSGQTYGYRSMYKYRSYNTLFSHNTFHMDHNYASGDVIYDYYPTGCEYYNNILYHAGTGRTWYLYGSSTVTGADYNNFFTNGSILLYWDGSAKADISAVKATTTMNQNSISKAVTFRDVFNGDLHLSGPSEDDSDLFGTLLTTVTDDIDHELRVQPYLGADEACYVLPGALTYEFVDGQGLQAAYAEAPGTIGIKYGVTFPPFASTVTFTVQFYNPVTNALVYQTTFQASKQANVDLFGTQYITLPASLPPGAYRIEVIFNTKNSCDVYRDYMPYPSALLIVPEGRVPCVVWPGDVNNDGIVTYVDRRELNYYIYNANLRTSWLNGPQRYQADAEINPFTYLEWKPQAAAPWFTPEGCYMDTDGNGTINNLDYLAMKLNWTKVTPWYGGTPKAGVQAAAFFMDQNYPNPFNPVTAIRYNVPEHSHVRLVVTDALGRDVATLVDGDVEKGLHTAEFDGTRLSSGTYIATILMTNIESSATYRKTIKMALRK